ncbi:MAG: hypothetical protein LBM02_10060 [Lachnospiraceae bacterium]|jgi:hypothetical protein|nr:hypothetical protein [Lachnospiraceae bacterium]
MSCNCGKRNCTCGKIHNPCGCGKPACEKCPKACNCPVQVTTDCVVFENDILPIVGAKQCDTLTSILFSLEAYLGYLDEKIGDKVKFTNTGVGNSIFTEDSDGNINLKGIVGGTGIDVTSDDKSVTVGVNEGWLDGKIDSKVNAIPKVTLTNTGSGTKLVTGGPDYGVKTLGSSDGTLNINNLEDGGVNITLNKDILPKGVSNKGTGIKLANDDGSISTIKSNSLNISKEEDGTVFIESIAKGFGYIKEYYVNSGYVVTEDSPSDGSVIRPFRTFEEAYKAVVGNGDFVHPDNKYAVIKVQTYSETSINPTINTVTIELQNNVTLVYTGNDLYMFDSEKAYPLLSKNSDGNINESFYMKLRGQGTFTKTTIGGIVNVKGSRYYHTEDSNNPNSISFVINESDTDSLVFLEPTSYLSEYYDADQVDSLGAKYGDRYTPAATYKLTSRLEPLYPVIRAYGESNPGLTYSINMNLGKIKIVTAVNKAISVTKLNIGGTYTIEPYGTLISVKDGTRVDGHPEVYAPKSGMCMVELIESTLWNSKFTAVNGGTFSHYGYDSFFRLVGKSGFNSCSFDYASNYWFNSLFDMTLATVNSFAYSGTFAANGKKLIAGANITDFWSTGGNFSTFDSITDNPDLNINTNGTFVTINGKIYNSGISAYASNNDAKTAGLLKNAIYMNSTTNTISKVY